MATALYAARRPFQYGDRIPEDVLDLDQVTQLRGMGNDERLVRLGYLSLVSEGISIVKCGYCGAGFTTDYALNNHGKRRHSKSEQDLIKDASPISDEQIQRKLESGRLGVGHEDESASVKMADEISTQRPLYMDKTEASVKSGDVKPPEISTKPKGK